jgi:hypothetical protein
MGSGGTNEGAFIENGGPRRKEIRTAEGEGPGLSAPFGEPEGTAATSARDSRDGLVARSSGFVDGSTERARLARRLQFHELLAYWTY